MRRLAKEETDALKNELSLRGYNTSNIKPCGKKWTVGLCKKLYLYIDGIEADTREQAIDKAFELAKSGGWDDYNNSPEISDCYEEK